VPAQVANKRQASGQASHFWAVGETTGKLSDNAGMPFDVG
jgi:hypothetical protein